VCVCVCVFACTIGQVFAVLTRGEQGWMAFKLCYDVNDRKQQVLLTCSCAKC
jgi:hypothetical protein